MNQTELSKALRGAAGDRVFITATQLARAMGRSDTYKVKQRYLNGLDHVGGMYFIPDVSERIMKEVTHEA